jgi:hypothetical protein
MQIIPSPQAYSQFTNLLQQQLQLPLAEITQRVNPQLIAPYYLKLPSLILKQAQNLGSILFKNLPTNCEGFSACIDFHWVKDLQQLKIIECNTNAAFLGLSLPLYQAHQLQSLLSPSQLVAQWTHYTQQDFSLNPQLAIVDEAPENQKLYIEFLYFQKIFNSMGAQAHICDVAVLPDTVDAIYNRSTNFLLDNEAHQKINRFWIKNPNLISPNPQNYLNFADKNNLITWQKYTELSAFLAPTHLLDLNNQDSIWLERKKYFIKPRSSFGSKSTYRGESILKKLFFQLIQEKSMIAQEFIPAPELNSPDHGNLKFDLRFYYHQNQVTQAIARLYQGQVTNSRSPGGGFSPILWYN